MFINWKTILGLSVVVLALMGGWWLDHKGSQSEIDKLKVEKQIIQDANETTQKTLEEVQKQAENQRQRITSLQQRLQEAEQYGDQLRQLFLDHDLTNLAEEKPELIERRINNATKELFDSIEQFTRDR